MFARKIHLIAVLCIAVLLSACQTARKYYERGDYDGAVDYTVKRLRGKKNKKTELVQGLEVSFEKAQDRDLLIAKRLIAQGLPENWIKVHSLYQKVERRQGKVRPLLPLVSKDGYKAKFDLINVSALEHDSRKNAANYLYNQAENLLSQASANNDRAAAREAYDLLVQIEQKYFKNYLEKDRLKQEARALGTTWVYVQMDNAVRHPLPPNFENELMAMNKRQLDEDWIAFMFDNSTSHSFDYTVNVVLENISISPERVAERRYTDVKTIVDGWEYVLDDRGNVTKDSLGNDIKVDRYVDIRADVIEVYQTKAARLDVSVVVFDRNGSRLDDRRLTEEVLFENYASTFIGDKRALSKASCQRIGNQPMPFPTGEALLLDAACRMRADLQQVISRSRVIW